MDEHEIEARGMRLANRAYLYRVFHIIFGAEPSKAELGVLGDQTTLDAVRFLSATRIADTPCAQATTSANDPTAESAIGPTNALEASRAAILSDTVELLESIGKNSDDVKYLDSLRASFTRLFLVPSESYVYLWESPYIGKETMLFQESTLDVRRRFAEHGFAATEAGNFPEDHLSRMLDFLAHLSTQAFDAFGAGDDREVERILASQDDFVSEHLTRWLVDFRRELSGKDELGIYSQFAEALCCFLEIDALYRKATLQVAYSLSPNA